MNRTRWLYLVVAVLCVAGLLASGCAEPAPAPAPVPAPTPPAEEEEEWVPPIPGMKKGEEDLYLEWTWATPTNRAKPPAGYELTADEWFFKEIEERAKGHLKVKISYGEMGTALEIPKLITAGVVEGGFTTPTYYPIELPLCNVLWMPFFSLEDWAKNMRLWDYALRHPLVQANYAKQNQVFGYMFNGTWDYDLYIRKGVPKITKVEDFKGLTARSYGYYNVFWQELEVGPVFVTAFESYEAMQKGMIDLCHLGLESVVNWHLWEVSDRIIDTAITATGTLYAVNMDVWNDTPQYIRDIWNEVHPLGQEYSLELGLTRLEEVKQFMQEKGIEHYRLSPEEDAKFRAAAKPAFEKWVADVEQQENGKPIREYLKDVIAYRDKLSGEPWTVYTP